MAAPAQRRWRRCSKLPAAAELCEVPAPAPALQLGRPVHGPSPAPPPPLPSTSHPPTQGITLGLVEDREKNSEALGRSVLFKGSSSLAGLPPYLTVQMMRFYYKADVRQKAKILRKVRVGWGAGGDVGMGCRVRRGGGRGSDGCFTGTERLFARRRQTRAEGGMMACVQQRVASKPWSRHALGPEPPPPGRPAAFPSLVPPLAGSHLRCPCRPPALHMPATLPPAPAR
jgi:hypothetical protein